MSAHENDDTAQTIAHLIAERDEDDYALAVERGDIAPIDADPLIYENKAGRNDRHGGVHPTVKPIRLMQYLIRHVTPKGGRVLDPFAGSGTTGIAARREGCDCTLIEQEDEYMAFLGKRLGVAPQKVAHRVRVRP